MRTATFSVLLVLASAQAIRPFQKNLLVTTSSTKVGFRISLASKDWKRRRAPLRELPKKDGSDLKGSHLRITYSKIATFSFDLKDGVDLPKPITFDLEEVDEGQLPKSQLSFMCDAEHGSVMARTFIEQYYQIYDSDDRSSLVQAYHDTAHFSMMCHITSSDSHSMFSNYISESRNLLKFNNSEKRLKLLKIGKHSIVEALKNFPGTEHDPTTFVVDLVFFTPELIQLIVSGLFREKIKPNSGAPIKFFSRTFIIVPVGAGFCIVNEQLCIHYPTTAQIKQMASKPKSAVPAMSAPGPSVIPSPLASNMAPAVNGVSAEILAKQQMVTDLAAKSGMNLVWSEKCLAESNWNLEQAVFAFMQLRERGTIPMEAFQK